MGPTFTADTLGEDTMKSGRLDLWGSQPADSCTGNAFWGCTRSAPDSGNYLNPIQSARLRSVNSFNFKYGRAEIRAKLPKGDWIWPAIWFLPKDNAYGQWPASGEIDLVESRGNSCAGAAGGSESFGTTLYWGPDYHNDAYEKATSQYKHTESLGNDFHVYGLDWSEDGIKSTIRQRYVVSRWIPRWHGQSLGSRKGEERSIQPTLLSYLERSRRWHHGLLPRWRMRQSLGQ